MNVWLPPVFGFQQAAFTCTVGSAFPAYCTSLFELVGIFLQKLEVLGPEMRRMCVQLQCMLYMARRGTVLKLPVAPSLLFLSVFTCTSQLYFAFSFQIDQLFNFPLIILKISPWERGQQLSSLVKQLAIRRPQHKSGSSMVSTFREKVAVDA